MNRQTLQLSLLIFAFTSAKSSFAQSGYKLQKQISLSGNGNWDYLRIDEPGNRILVSHGDRVNVIDLKTEKEIGTIKNQHGAHHIITLPQYNKGYISNGDNNSVYVFNYTTLDSVTTIKIKGENPDPMCFDKFSKKLYVFCDNNLAVIIDPATAKVTGEIKLKGTPEFALPDDKGLIYNNLESTDAMNIIDVSKKAVIKTYKLQKDAAPTGMAADLKNNRLFVVCRGINQLAIIDSKSGKIITSLPISAKVDGVYFDEKKHTIFCSGGDGFLTIITQKSKDEYRVVEKLQTKIGAKTMALDNRTHNIYLTAADFNKNEVMPNSFALFIYSKK